MRSLKQLVKYVRESAGPIAGQGRVPGWNSLNAVVPGYCRYWAACVILSDAPATRCRWLELHEEIRKGLKETTAILRTTTGSRAYVDRARNIEKESIFLNNHHNKKERGEVEGLSLEIKKKYAEKKCDELTKIGSVHFLRKKRLNND